MWYSNPCQGALEKEGKTFCELSYGNKHKKFDVKKTRTIISVLLLERYKVDLRGGGGAAERQQQEEVVGRGGGQLEVNSDQIWENLYTRNSLNLVTLTEGYLRPKTGNASKGRVTGWWQTDRNEWILILRMFNLKSGHSILHADLGKCGLRSTWKTNWRRIREGNPPASLHRQAVYLHREEIYLH